MTCQDCGTTGTRIRGPVEMRWPGYGHRSFPRCEKCGDARLERERGNIERNFSTGPIGDDVPAFDPDNAGECFEEEP